MSTLALVIEVDNSHPDMQDSIVAVITLNGNDRRSPNGLVSTGIGSIHDQ